MMNGNKPGIQDPLRSGAIFGANPKHLRSPVPLHHLSMNNKNTSAPNSTEKGGNNAPAG
jgi:hypothetical protein